ncbi:hypothetical protein LB566_28845 [Mesorhizobium sp. CA13]|uniref:hypothetical protein n=1 Tax=Mesorhizobium sp. CA13 TaxID=2876643 RepID=UPI001CCAE3A7|nr:hypothetical protein [Mesorhizobium sp. CA13]MBZ9857795.1 hypothetical protein [Mesorhizobium sp. CA13]
MGIVLDLVELARSTYRYMTGVVNIFGLLQSAADGIGPMPGGQFRVMAARDRGIDGPGPPSTVRAPSPHSSAIFRDLPVVCLGHYFAGHVTNQRRGAKIGE